MKRIAMILLALSVLVACVPTPDHEFVIGKQDAVTDTAILVTAAPITGETVGETNGEPDGETQSAPHVTLAERIGAPAHYAEEEFSKKVPFDTLKVQIDADVHVPDTEKVGVYTATFDMPFSETQQKALILRYFGEERPFCVNRKSSGYWRKWQIEEEIKLRQKELERNSALEDKKMREIMTEQSNRQLKQAMESYKKAPEDWEHLEWDGSLAKGRGEKATYITLYANTDQPAHYKRISFSAYSFDYNDETQPVYELHLGIGVNYRDATAIAPATEAERTAAALAEAELNALGIGTFRVKTVQPGVDTSWQASDVDYPATGLLVQLWYTVDGLPFYDFQAWHGDDNLMNYVEANGMKEGEDYSVYMPGQYRAEVGVRDGKVVSIGLEGMHSITGCVNDNVQLLPFEKVIEIFKEQIAYHYFTGDYEDPDSGKGETLHITDIRLSMMRVRKKDSPEEFYLLPVWDFTGYFESAMWPIAPEDLEREKLWGASLSYLTINAVDGTIIDRNKGY